MTKFTCFLLMFLGGLFVVNAQPSEMLRNLFEEWRSFETPPIYQGVPDYRKATFESRHETFQQLKTQLERIDTTDWSVENRIDWEIIQAEMNGYDFNYRVLKPWERDPAFYKVIWMDRSDVPGHEGPTPHNVIEVWQLNFPLVASDAQVLTQQLSTLSNFYQQARLNLIGNAKELWVAGIRDIQFQIQDLENLLTFPGVEQNAVLTNAIQEAISASQSFAEWLAIEGARKTGPSGIGKDNYTWYQQNVHLVPLTWAEEVLLLKRELVRAWSALKLEEHRNRNLPPLIPAANQEEYLARAEQSVRSLIDFLDQQDIVTVEDYFEPALRAHLGGFVPVEKRNFFWITAHHDQRPLYSHFYHWFELAQMDLNPHDNLIRKKALLYNIFDSRNEGLATAVEEMFMQTGLYHDNPRVREIVYIMIAQRAARGLGSLYAHANLMTMEEAGGIHADYTPRGWMKTEKELLLFEQHLYLRQPGYGTSYITGKYLIEMALGEFARVHPDKSLKEFFDGLSRIGNIPMELAKWSLTGVREFAPY